MDVILIFKKSNLRSTPLGVFLLAIALLLSDNKLIYEPNFVLAIRHSFPLFLYFLRSPLGMIRLPCEGNLRLRTSYFSFFGRKKPPSVFFFQRKKLKVPKRTVVVRLFLPLFLVSLRPSSREEKVPEGVFSQRETKH